MMERRTFLVMIAGGLLTAPLAAEAQQPGKVYRIGWLASTPPTTPEALRVWEAFTQGLRDLGYVEGKNILIERRYSEGRFERLPELAAELVRLKVDLIVASAAPEARAAKQATLTIPIVMVAAGEAVEVGLVASLARPGGNVTGLTQMLPELTGKRLELLKEIVPKLSRVAILWNSANPAKVPDWKGTQVAARTLGIALYPAEVRGPDDFERAFNAMSREKLDALMTLDDPLTTRYRTQIVDFAAKKRLPAVYGVSLFVADADGLMSYGTHYPDLFRRAAAYVDKILKGAKPADLPIEQPTKFELVINLKTAKALGLTIPPSLLLRADEVIR